MSSSPATQPAQCPGRLIVTLLAFAALGPYVSGGIRTEQVAVYAFSVAVLALTFSRLRATVGLAWVVVLWSTYIAIQLVGTLAPPIGTFAYPRGLSTFAGIDNTLLPLAMLLLIAGLVTLGARPDVLVPRAAAAVVAAMCLNAVVAALQFQFNLDLSLWQGQGETSTIISVADLAADHGRFSGFVNQPAEAGVLYSTAGLAAVYALRARAAWLAAALSLIVIGGVLTTSKVFLLIGLPLILLSLVRGSKGRATRGLALFVVVAGGFGLIASGVLPDWPGVKNIEYLLNSNQTFVETVTANRFGGDRGGTLSSVIDTVLAGPWAFGFGAAGLATAYDSGWVEALIVAGLAGIVLQLAVFTVLVRWWLKMPSSPERSLMGGLTVMLFLSQVGIPALTANRAATVVWLLLSCLLLWTGSRRQEVDDDEDAAISSRPTTSASS